MKAKYFAAVTTVVLGAATIAAGIILINLGFLGAAVWVVVKTFNI